ncbi:uncharacterized protein Gasu_33580 [Galdieria sulphuraria]|uniref:Fucosyltransferase n=1 Tax=Galdieria sulphuraria TaxID=130081 RepID=M2WYM6_GALSU|nr:uncharacterized protein Gasu_33580 [Galdieria sulphuraria]EME29155.1 hypothetical protein Gasu_33580 [Galdieria sulphuraria]|eukprot:XP_005705675.1 hypothetical protein Gasu_33580 [Galdieria sulphuraria]
MICVLAVYSHDNLALKHHLSHRFTEEPNEVLDCFGKKNVNFNDNEILNFRRHMICKAFLKTLLVLCWHVTTLILFNCTASYFLGFPQVWQQVLHADVQNHLLETTEQLRSLCSSTEENSGALLEVALTRQQELAQQALRRNLSIPLLIYTQSSSGWGNNILGLISTLLLAMVTKRALFVHFHPVKLENIIQDKWGVFPDLSLLATSRNMSLEKLMKNQVYSIHASEHDQIWLPFTKQMERAYLNILRFHTDSISFSNVVLQSNQFFAPLLYIRKDYNYQLCRILGRFISKILQNSANFRPQTGNRPFYSIANKVLQFTPEIKRAALVFMQEMQFHKKLVIGKGISSISAISYPCKACKLG